MAFSQNSQQRPDLSQDIDRYFIGVDGAQKGKILIVDDDPSHIELYRRQLSKSGYDVVTATSGDQALKIIHDDSSLELMITDIRMTPMDGYQLADEAKKYLSGFPVIFITAADLSPGDTQKVTVDGYFIKNQLDFTSLNVQLILNRYISNYRHLRRNHELINALKESESKFFNLYYYMSEGVSINHILYDREGRPVDYILRNVNRAFMTMVGKTEDDIIGSKASTIFRASPPPHLEVFETVSRTREPQAFEVHYRQLNKHFHISVFSPRDNVFATLYTDISKRKTIEAKLIRKNKYDALKLKVSQMVVRAEASLETMLDEITETIRASLHLSGVYLLLRDNSSGTARLRGSDAGTEKTGDHVKNFYEIAKSIRFREADPYVIDLRRKFSEPVYFNREEVPEFIARVLTYFAPRETVPDPFPYDDGDMLVVPLDHSQGQLIIVKQAQAPRNDDDVMLARELGHAIASVIDIHYKAYYDKLTGLPNQTMQRLVMKRWREKQRPFSLFSMKIEQFNRIVASRGDDLGNELLVKITGRLTCHPLIQEHRAVVTRPPGAGFAVVFPTIEEKVIMRFAQSMINFFATPIIIQGNTISMSIRIGVAFSRDDDDVEKIIQNSRVALSKAQDVDSASDQTGTKVKVYTDQMSRDLHEQQSLEVDLRRALKERTDFHVYYQPKCDMDGIIKGYEALVRWTRRGEMVSPGVFISTIEAMGMNHELFDIVLDKVCQLSDRWNDYEISINVSPQQLHNPDLTNEIKRKLEDYNINTSQTRLKFEIMETQLLEAVNLNVLRNFKNLGIKIAVDDFGSGYSNLRELKNLARESIIDEVKIDKSLIDDICQDSLFLSTILEMVKSLGIDVVVEGVETLDQYSIIRNMYDKIVIQGWVFSPAVPYEKMIKFKRDQFLHKVAPLSAHK